jgi:hypothetical protein
MSSPDELKSTPRYDRMVAASRRIAWDLGHSYVAVEHLFLAVVQDPDAVPNQVLSRFVPPAQVGAAVRDHHLGRMGQPQKRPTVGLPQLLRSLIARQTLAQDVPGRHTTWLRSPPAPRRSVPHQESADTGGHQRSRRVRTNFRSQYLPAHDLGRPSSVEAARICRSTRRPAHGYQIAGQPGIMGGMPEVDPGAGRLRPARQAPGRLPTPCSRLRPRTQTLLGVLLGSLGFHLFGRLVAEVP